MVKEREIESQHQLASPWFKRGDSLESCPTCIKVHCGCFKIMESSTSWQLTNLVGIDRIRFVYLCSATTKQSVYTQKTENQQWKKRDDTDVNVETQMWEKPRQSTNCRIHYGRGVQPRGYTEATTSCPLLRHTRKLQLRQRPLSLSLSLSLVVSIHMRYTTSTYKKLFNNIL